MDEIKKVMMKMNFCNRMIDMEEQILGYQCFLAMQALEINKPGGNMNLLKEIMGTIEKTYMEAEDYRVIKAEILLDMNDWKEVTLVYNTLMKTKKELPDEMNERIPIIQEKIKERENKNRKNRLISCSNQISKN
jgi:hypothetical protein